MDDIEQNDGGHLAVIARIVLVIVIVTGPITSASDQSEPRTSARRIERLIEQLGDDDYLVRQQAQEKLAEFGFQACDALAMASTHEDLEIASRAKYLLRLMQVEWTIPSDPREVKAILTDFGRLSVEERTKKIRALAALPDGMGVVALCRLARFEKSNALSKYAALEILKLEPFDVELRGQRADMLREHLGPSRRTAVNWVLTLIELRQNPEAPLSQWKKLVEAEQADGRNGAPRLNAQTVIWLLYHQAILEADREDLDSAKKSVAAARNVDAGARPDLLEVHLEIANTLQRWGFFDWAEAEYRRVIGAGVWEPWFPANFGLAQMKHDGGEHAAAGEVLQTAIDFIHKEAKARALSDISLIDAELRGRMNYFISCHWAQKGDTEKQREYVDLALKADPAEIDALIARHRLPDTDEEYRRKTKLMIEKAANELRQKILKAPQKAPYYNQWAWLVGNTDGDLNEALKYAQTALRISPNNGAFLDTLAHVYFARGEYEKAVKTQEEAVRFEPHSGLILKKLKLFRDKLEEQRTAGRPGGD
jgi:tetratricopeptide (TPR) repeat protein